ncbi:kappaPI-actitoxin-Avd3d-like [Drosophila innubila]|uniref:kappaPI-actitoxin-Avd3d-like n=1 Tax=Drosophila innubila TaxID=198719 RepID=UPI00148BE4E3|nr:kappaPI-actitoxin-Avd3d-like [Drosophila innubila]
MMKLMQLTVILSCIICLTSAINLTMAIQQRKAVCTLNYSYGSCHSRTIRWFYDFVSDRCMKFIYSSCGGNQNRFNSRYECISYCMNPANRYNMQDFENEYF